MTDRHITSQTLAELRSKNVVHEERLIYRSKNHNCDHGWQGRKDKLDTIFHSANLGGQTLRNSNRES